MTPCRNKSCTCSSMKPSIFYRSSRMFSPCRCQRYSEVNLRSPASASGVVVQRAETRNVSSPASTSGAVVPRAETRARRNPSLQTYTLRSLSYDARVKQEKHLCECVCVFVCARVDSDSDSCVTHGSFAAQGFFLICQAPPLSAPRRALTLIAAQFAEKSKREL